MQRKSGHYTLMLVPSSTGKVRRIQIPRFVITACVVGAIIAGFALLYFVGNYVILKDRLASLQQLEQLTRLQQERISVLATKVGQFSETIKELRDLEKRLEVMAGGGDNGSDEISLEEGLGRGGPDEYAPLGVFDPVGLTTSPLDAISVLERNVSLLQNEATVRQRNLVTIERIIEEQKGHFACTPNIYPVKGWISTGYGWRTNPFTQRREMHRAIDIVSAWGTPIKAACKGTITHAGWKDFYGLCVEIVNEYEYRTVYGHLSKVLVKKGQQVEKGEVIGRVGSSGRSTGPHVHFEVWKGDTSINPFTLMVEPLGKPH